MAVSDIRAYLKLLPLVDDTPGRNVWLNYDKEADVLYINFKKPSYATDSELTDEDVIIRFEEERVIGYTVLNVSKR